MQISKQINEYNNASHIADTKYTHLSGCSCPLFSRHSYHDPQLFRRCATPTEISPLSSQQNGKIHNLEKRRLTKLAAVIVGILVKKKSRNYNLHVLWINKQQIIYLILMAINTTLGLKCCSCLLRLKALTRLSFLKLITLWFHSIRGIENTVDQIWGHILKSLF